MGKFYAVRPQERNWLDLGDGAGIWYRRLTLGEIHEVVTESTERGLRDNIKLTITLCAKTIMGWEGYTEPLTGEPIPYPQDVKTREEAIAAMPHAILNAVAIKAQATDIDLRADLGNSEKSSASGGQPDVGTTATLQDHDGTRSPASVVDGSAPAMKKMSPVTPLARVPILPTVLA